MKLLPAASGVLSVTVSVLAGAAFAPTSTAQVLNEHCARLSDTNLTGFARQGGAGNTVAYDAIFSRRDFAGWGHDPANPGMRRVDGVRATLGDSDGSSAEQVEFWVYPEDAANPGNPNFAAGAGVAYSLFGTGGSGAQQAFVFDLVFPSPIMVADNGDTFLEVYLDGTAAPQTLVGLLQGAQIATLNYDIANARAADTGHGLGIGGYTFIFDFGIQQAFFSESQLHISPLVADQPGLALGVRTNQTNLPGSLAPNYSASFFSALQPSDTMDRLGRTRADDMAWFWNDGRFVAGETVVFIMAANGLSPSPFSLDPILAGSSGTICLDSGVPWVVVGSAATDAAGQARAALMIDATARGTLAGISFAYQGILLDLATASAHASGCAVQQW